MDLDENFRIRVYWLMYPAGSPDNDDDLQDFAGDEAFEALVAPVRPSL